MCRKDRAFQNPCGHLNVKMEGAAQASDTVPGKLEGPHSQAGALGSAAGAWKEQPG